MRNTIYLRKEKQVRLLRRIDTVDKFQYTNTLGMGLAWDYNERDSRVYERCKTGHIEVSVRELGGEHFSERLEEFLVRAAALYDEVVLGNTKLDEPEIVKVD